MWCFQCFHCPRGSWSSQRTSQGQQVTVISMLMLFVEPDSQGGEMALPAREEWTLIGAKL